jgi:hypothetical protein
MQTIDLGEKILKPGSGNHINNVKFPTMKCADLHVRALCYLYIILVYTSFK